MDMTTREAQGSTMPCADNWCKALEKMCREYVIPTENVKGNMKDVVMKPGKSAEGPGGSEEPGEPAEPGEEAEEEPGEPAEPGEESKESRVAAKPHLLTPFVLHRILGKLFQSANITKDDIIVDISLIWSPLSHLSTARTMLSCAMSSSVRCMAVCPNPGLVASHLVGMAGSSAQFLQRIELVHVNPKTPLGSLHPASVLISIDGPSTAFKRAPLEHHAVMAAAIQTQSLKMMFSTRMCPSYFSRLCNKHEIDHTQWECTVVKRFGLGNKSCGTGYIYVRKS